MHLVHPGLTVSAYRGGGMLPLVHDGVHMYVPMPCGFNRRTIHYNFVCTCHLIFKWHKRLNQAKLNADIQTT